MYPHFKRTIFLEYIILTIAPTKKDIMQETHAPHNPNIGIKIELHKTALPAAQILE